MRADVKQQLEAAVGRENMLTEREDMAPYLQEWRGHFTCEAAAVLRPGSTQEVAAVVRVCAQHGVGVVPQGGNTGLVGGAAAQTQDQVVVSLSRLRQVRSVDVENDSITVEAGCVLAQVQTAAEEASRLFPLSLAAEGSCQIGGNLATNAGGLNVLRYGNARDLCLGLEVVLADGSVWNGLGALRKDNSGFDLKQVFIGSEGALGIITAATLKLFPPLRQTETAFIALEDPKSAIRLLNELRRETGDNLIACELIPRFAIELVTRHVERCRDPFSSEHPWYLLIEAATPASGEWLGTAVKAVLQKALEEGLVSDAVLAESLQHAEDFWRIRENIPGAQVSEGASIKHDVSVMVSRIPELIEKAGAAVTEAAPGVRICAFGHVGDGNLHFNLSQPVDAEAKIFMARATELNQIVNDIVVGMGGSFSAEHGVGRLKTKELQKYKSEQAILSMQKIKQALDPQGIMNPGVILALEPV